MEELDKARLKANLEDRLRQAREALPGIQVKLSYLTTAVELWYQLDETQELGSAIADLNAAKLEQQKLEASISRYERGLDFLRR